ncbi:MAG: hypothetical protein K8R54_18685 [Bacteroidales bacterium]|nr:hypothetical protein [Bacteroidales bacterium]
MILNNAGRMIEHWYFESENKYPDKKYHEPVVMPNHFHCIIENIPDAKKPGDHVTSGRPRKTGQPRRDAPHIR